MVDRPAARCRVGLKLDGFQFGELPAGTIDQPFMLMYSQPAEGASDFIFDRTTNVAYRAVVAGANHMNYSDYTLFPRCSKQSASWVLLMGNAWPGLPAPTPWPFSTGI